MATAIIIPGLGSRTGFAKWATRDWEKKFGITPMVNPICIDWKNDGKLLQKRIQQLKDEILRIQQDGSPVILIGVSAGGSLALNVFAEIPTELTYVVNVSGRLRSLGWPSLSSATKGNPLFRASVELCEQRITKLTSEVLSKVITYRGWVDEAVPLSSSVVLGARNVQVCSVAHSLNIASAFIHLTYRFFKAG